MKKNAFAILIVILLFASGCTLAPQYSRPAAPVPDTWKAQADQPDSQATETAIQIAGMKWQEFFTDENLKQLIETALANNRDLRLAALNAERARGLYGIQRAELMPSISAEGLGGKQHEGAAVRQDEKSVTIEEYRANLRIPAWEIDFFGRVRSLKDQALEAYLATEEARKSAQIALIASVAQTYLALASDREALNIATATLNTQQAAYDLILHRYNVGIANELDLRRVQTQVDTAKGDVARYKQQLALDENALNLLLGTPVQRSLMPSDLNSVVLEQKFFISMNSAVLLSRPDILGAEHQLKGAYANIGAARAVFFPNISLTTAIGTASNDLSGLFESGSGTWGFTPQFSMPIFDARTWSALTVSKTDQQIALTQYEKTIQTAFKEVADSLAVLETVDDQLAAQQSLLNALSDTYNLSRDRYNKGIDSYLGVLDAQQSLYAAEQGLVTLRLAKLIHQVQMYTVLGGGAQ